VSGFDVYLLLSLLTLTVAYH